jgi:hypothetical protein
MLAIAKLKTLIPAQAGTHITLKVLSHDARQSRKCPGINELAARPRQQNGAADGLWVLALAGMTVLNVPNQSKCASLLAI